MAENFARFLQQEQQRQQQISALEAKQNHRYSYHDDLHLNPNHPHLHSPTAAAPSSRSIRPLTPDSSLAINAANWAFSKPDRPSSLRPGFDYKRASTSSLPTLDEVSHSLGPMNMHRSSASSDFWNSVKVGYATPEEDETPWLRYRNSVGSMSALSQYGLSKSWDDKDKQQKEKGKIPEQLDLTFIDGTHSQYSLKFRDLSPSFVDIPHFLRSLRLHKYSECFKGVDWKTMVKYTDAQLEQRGVLALGARRKMLKVFELVKKQYDETIPESA